MIINYQGEFNICIWALKPEVHFFLPGIKQDAAGGKREIPVMRIHPLRQLNAYFQYCY